MKKEDILLYLEELGINDNAGELSELTEKLLEQESNPLDYEPNYFACLDDLDSNEESKPLTGDLYEKPDYYGEYYPFVVLSLKGWPLHFGWTVHPDSIVQDAQIQASKIVSVQVSETGYTEEIATNWVEEQVENFKNFNNHKPYLQDKILA